MSKAKAKTRDQLSPLHSDEVFERCRITKRSDSCHLGKKNRDRAELTADSVRDFEILSLRQTLNRQQSLLEMLLVLVDPEDVEAAMKLHRGEDGLTHKEISDMADRCVPPHDLFDAD